jgi:hypothetical protein
MQPLVLRSSEPDRGSLEQEFVEIGSKVVAQAGNF